MALTEIVDTADIHTELGGSLSAADLTLLGSIQDRAEAAIRSYVRWPITEDTYTVYLPAYGNPGQRLQLIHPFVSAVASVYEDRQSRGGQQSGDFSSATKLTEGTDFWIDYDQSAYSREGVLFRYAWEWPSFPRSVKVTYTAGFDATALANEFLYIKDAVIDETIERFHYRKARQGSSGVSGTIKSEKIGDYSVSYAIGADALSSNVSGLKSSTESMLQPIMFYGHML
tara:strand:+ start:9586 stop:10269 length:684 start_codon:yes stop_codon:yes gene_type:complete